MNFEEGITHFLEKRVNLTNFFRNVGAITAGQVGSTSITVDGDLEDVKLFAVKTPLFAVVNILVLCLLAVLFAICLDISLITPAC
jgi:hypothetical protein